MRTSTGALLLAVALHIASAKWPFLSSIPEPRHHQTSFGRSEGLASSLNATAEMTRETFDNKMTQQKLKQAREENDELRKSLRNSSKELKRSVEELKSATKQLKDELRKSLRNNNKQLKRSVEELKSATKQLKELKDSRVHGESQHTQASIDSKEGGTLYAATFNNSEFASTQPNLTGADYKSVQHSNSREGSQPFPAAFIYTKELYTPNANRLRNNTNSTVAMNPEVYRQLTNKIRRTKHERKPLLIMIQTHPCAGKSFFIQSERKKERRNGRKKGTKKGTKKETYSDSKVGYFMGVKLLDHDYIGRMLPGNSSALLNMKNNTALLGQDKHFGRDRSNRRKLDDVIYIYVIPPMTAIERNVEARRREGSRVGNWDELGEVTNRRRSTLLYAIKNGHDHNFAKMGTAPVLVEPLFASFQEGLEFCINTYNTA